MSRCYTQTPPETLRQARTWDEVKRQALNYGLCHSCAAKMAYGVRDGFSNYDPPCRNCIALIQSLPRERHNGWHTPGDRADRKSSWTEKPKSRERSSQLESVRRAEPSPKAGAEE